MQGASTIQELVVLEIPFPYSPLLSQNQTDTRITLLDSCLSSPLLAEYTDVVYSGTLYHFKKLLFGISPLLVLGCITNCIWKGLDWDDSN